ncbi:DUF1641 domain-containing protein [Alicyclobacillus tolerans]|uniref:DUF1641 domain-containing protein n=1 Tax=Alicyclobacillus tolerans TaxID=90970 RepID=UPI001F2F52E3|nr:DUF1641 domain-containing protein [Alicyclobacillus tolerans]MCF8563386.1 DUF1641 domain-containing protein [Alicyclobacillus tolerans]
MEDTLQTKGTFETDVFELIAQPEIQRSLIEIAQQLPKLAQVIHLLGKTYDVMEEVLQDPDLLEGLGRTVRQKTGPIQKKLDELSQVVQEAKLRASEDTGNISVFSLLGLLRDPVVQDNLRFVRAFLTVLSEREAETPMEDSEAPIQ